MGRHSQRRIDTERLIRAGLTNEEIATQLLAQGLMVLSDYAAQVRKQLGLPSERPLFVIRAAQLAALVAQGVVDEVTLAQRLACSRYQVRTAARRAGLAIDLKQVKPSTTRQEVARLLRELKTVAQVSRELGISQQRVSQIRAALLAVSKSARREEQGMAGAGPADRRLDFVGKFRRDVS